MRHNEDQMLHTYNDAIAYLERLVATPVQSTPEAGPARARLLLARVGAPQNRFATLHVTGSAGKGSTATLSAAVLRAASYRTGLFTSPHLRDYTERIAVDGAPISREEWTRLLERLRPSIEEMGGNTVPGYTLGRPAFMEALWALAALYFAARAVEVAIVEVGVGGRYDPTVVNSARVGVITNVSLEHTRRLGPTVADIAGHKAGIVKPHGILVTAAEGDALRVIAAECARQDATLWRVTPEGDDGDVLYAHTGAALRVTTPVRAYDDLRLALLGRHQWTNAACAVGAVDALGVLGIARAGDDAVRRGLAETRVPGRLEWIAGNAGDPPTLLDGAHARDAARTLAAALRELLPIGAAEKGPRNRDARPVLLLGILGDKDIPAMVGALAPLAGAVVVTEPPWERRAGAAAIVAEEARRYLPDVTLVPDPADALSAAQNLARARGVPLVVTGSLILVGAVRRLVTNDGTACD